MPRGGGVPCVVLGVIVKVATLAEGFQIGPIAVGLVVIQMGHRQHDLDDAMGAEVERGPAVVPSETVPGAFVETLFLVPVAPCVVAGAAKLASLTGELAHRSADL